MSTPITPEEIKQAIAQTHYEAYNAAIKDGKTPGRAMQAADAVASAKGQALRTGSS